MKHSNRLGVRLRKLRERRGLSQTDLARLLGCCRATINRVEGGSRIPSLYHAVRLCLALHCSLDALVFRWACPPFQRGHHD